MSRHKSRRSPEKRAADLAEKERNREEIARLRQSGAKVNVDPRTGKLVGAWRLDVFGMLFQRGSITEAQHDAVCRLEALLHVALGFSTPERRPDHIRASTIGAPGQNVTQAMIDASRELRRIEERMHPREYGMLTDLLEGQAAIYRRWRAVVERRTGEATPHGQAAAIRAACENLSWALDGRQMAA